MSFAFAQCVGFQAFFFLLLTVLVSFYFFAAMDAYSPQVDDLQLGQLSQITDDLAKVQAAETQLDESMWAADELSPPTLKPLCCKCGFEVDVFRGQLKNKSRDHPRYICRDCNCISSILSKRLDIQQLNLGELPKAQQIEFWRSCAKVRELDDRFNYSRIRACLQETCIQRRLSTAGTKLLTEALPLSVWQQRGFDVAAIEAQAESENHPIFGKVYKVSLKSTSREEVAEQVKEMLMQAERQMSKKSSSSGSKASTDVDVVDLSDFESADAEPAPKRSKGKENSAKKTENEEKMFARLEAKRVELAEKKNRAAAEKANQKTIILATKTIGATSTLVQELDVALKADNSRIPDWLMDTIKQCHEDMSKYKKESQDRLGKSGKAAVKGSEMEPLTFSAADVSDLVKEANQSLVKHKKTQAIV